MELKKITKYKKEKGPDGAIWWVCLGNLRYRCGIYSSQKGVKIHIAHIHLNTKSLLIESESE